tara:strand:- start:75 stop:1901 length:1827 start_codon:yes stop_codon:yes gene_type:complete
MRNQPLSKHATAFWLAALFFSAASVLLTYAVYPQVFYPALLMDEWGELGFYLEKGFWPSVFCQQNNHVVILPKFFTRFLYLATDFDPFIRGLSTLLSASLLAIIAGYVSSRSTGRGETGSRLVRLSRFSVALALTLWLGCYQVLFWGMGTYIYFALLFSFAAVVALDAILHRYEKPGALLLLPALLATAGAISFTYGVAAWGALAVLLFFYRKPWQWIAATLAVGLGLFIAFRLSLPHCRPLSFLATDGSIADPLVMLQGLLSLVGSVWVHSLAPLATPSSFYAGVMGAVGLGILCWLTLPAWKATRFRTFKLLVTGCWLVAGMLLLVALGRNPANFALPDQMIAPRFMPLSIFYWTCLLAACSCRPGRVTPRADAIWGAVYAAVGCYLLVTALLTVNWMSSMRAQDMHFTRAEIEVEAIRYWVSPESSGDLRTTSTLGILDPPRFNDHVGELRARNWDFYRAFPTTQFPLRVTDLPGEAPAPGPSLPALTIDKAKITPSGTWTLNGSLQGDLPPGVRHLFFARGDKLIGYGVPSLYPAFEGKPREPGAAWRELPDRLSAAVSRLEQLLRAEQFWNGVSKVNPGRGEWQCEWRSETTLLCRAASATRP